ncbi:MAG: hypothetical protein ACR2N3_06010 [Pyrinomonadaceae bacterium]
MNIKNKTCINGILAMAILLAVGLGCSEISKISGIGEYGTKLEFNGGELYYTNNVTEAEARRLGNYLVKEGLFDGNRKTVQLDKAGSTYQFRVVVLKEKQNDPATFQIWKEAAAEISRDVFNNAPTEVHVCDDHLKTLRVITP